MKSTVETLTPTRVRLAVEITFDELKPSLDAAYRKIASAVRVPGFRPGKAPARIIEARVGRSAILEEAVNDALPKAYSEAVRESGVRTFGQPDIEVTNLDDGQSLSFTAEVDIRPTITVPDLSSLTVSVDDVEVTDDEVDQQLDGLRQRFGTLKGVERPAATGDYVSLDLVTRVDDAELAEGSASGMSYEVGSGELIDGLDEAIVGLSAGETAAFDTTLEQGGVATRVAQVTVTLNSVKENDLPAPDDEFAQLASEFDTVGELRDDLRTRISRVKALGQGSQARDKLLDHLVDVVEFDVPESAIESEINVREHDVIHSMGHDEAMFARFLDSRGTTREEFTAELRENAVRAVRAQLILDAIADSEELGVNDAELTEYLVRQAGRYNMAPQAFADEIVKAGNLPSLVAEVRRTKALATALSAATITDASGNTIDLSSLPTSQFDLSGPDDADGEDFAEGEHDHEQPHDHDHDHDHGDE